MKNTREAQLTKEEQGHVRFLQYGSFNPRQAKCIDATPDIFWRYRWNGGVQPNLA